MMREARVRVLSAVLASLALAAVAHAGTAKFDAETCNQLRAEQAGFVQAGILADIQHGPEWGKANLGADRMREIEHFFLLDENLKFGCREATLTPEAMRAGEEALKIEANPDADPNAPPAAPAAAKDAADTSAATPPAAGSSASNASGAEPKKPAVKPKVRRRAPPHPKQKAADDAFTPAPGSESTLQAPAAADGAPEAPAVKAQ